MSSGAVGALAASEDDDVDDDDDDDDDDADSTRERIVDDCRRFATVCAYRGVAQDIDA